MIFAATLLLAATMTANAQTAETADSTKMKSAKAAARETAYRETVAALENGDFVFQTEQVASDRTQTIADVDSTANFIAVKRDEGIIQTAPPMGPDNPTIQCRIRQRLQILGNELTFDKRGNVTCRLSVTIDDDPQTITIKLNKRRGEAVATCGENTSALLGRIVPASRATIEQTDGESAETAA